MDPNQRSGSSPTSQFDSRNVQPRRANIPGVGLVELPSQPNDPVAAQAAAASLPPMLFPGPYAYAPTPAALEADTAHADSSALPGTGSYAATGTSSSGSTASCTTTASATVVSSEPGRVQADDSMDRLPPLIRAAERGDLVALDALLLSDGIDFDQVVAGLGLSALMYAADAGHHLVVARLLAAGANLNLSSTLSGFRALEFAIDNADLTTVELLLAQPGLDLDATDKYGASALQHAALAGSADIVAALLRCGADLDAPVAPGMDPLSLAVIDGQLDIVRLLLRHRPVDIGQIVDSNGDTLLLHACLKGTPALAAFLLEHGGNLNRHNRAGFTPLAVVACNGHASVLAILLKAPGIDLNFADTNGDTPLSLAAGNGHVDVVVRLIAAGARVDVGDLGCKTALMKAADKGSVGCVQALLKHPRIGVNQVSEGGETALLSAVAAGHPEVVRALLLAGADAGRKTTGGMNAYIWAVWLSDAGVIEVLAEYGMPLAALASVPISMEEAPFLATAHDLILSVQLPADPETNPFGLRDPALLDHPQTFLAGMLAKFEQLHGEDADTSFQCLVAWMGEQGIRSAVSTTMLRCLTGIPTAWTGLAHAGITASTHQKLLYCASAMSRMPIPSAYISGAGMYRAEEITPAALKRLSSLASLQIDRLVAMAEQVLAELGAAMLGELVGNCLARTNMECQVSLDELKASLVGAGFYPPLAQAIALSWQAAIGRVQTMAIDIPPGLNVMQSLRVIREHTALHAPTLFAAEMQRQLAAHRLLENLQATMGKSNDEALHALFQIQCDQLRQFCAQLLDSDANTANTATTSSTSSISSTSSSFQQ